MDVVRAAIANRHRLAVVAPDGRRYTYGDVIDASSAYMKGATAALLELQSTTGAPATAAAATGPTTSTATLHDDADPSANPLAGHRIALMASPGPEYVAAMFAIWRMGCIAVPLALSHPRPELEYALSGAYWEKGRGE